MKKLTNVSPFLLLLVPVFIMMILTVSSNTGTSDSASANLKPATNTSVAVIPNAILK
ncbi:hypothetical protein [Pedobacter westerhofensis]|nr:hypothetical protein [Pedobacter westerhofensis]